MGWNSEFRYPGVPPDNRHKDLRAALSLRTRTRKMVPDRPKGKKERGRRPCGITAERVNHSKGKALEKFLDALGGAHKFSARQKLLFMDSTKHGGLEVLATWRQSQVEGWLQVGSWRIFNGSFTDAETGETFGPSGRFVFKEIDGLLKPVQWELELSREERFHYLPQSHPLHPNRKLPKRVSPGNRVAAPVANGEEALAMFSRALKKSRQ